MVPIHQVNLTDEDWRKLHALLKVGEDPARSIARGYLVEQPYEIRMNAHYLCWLLEISVRKEHKRCGFNCSSEVYLLWPPRGILFAFHVIAASRCIFLKSPFSKISADSSSFSNFIVDFSKSRWDSFLASQTMKSRPPYGAEIVWGRSMRDFMRICPQF